jgi:hypothetical protein
MKALKFIALAIMLPAATMVSAQATQFDTHRYETPTFSATFPMPDLEKVVDACTVMKCAADTPIPTTDKKGTGHGYILNRKNGATFVINYLAFPEGTLLGNDAATLDRIIDTYNDEKVSHLISIEKSDAQLSSLPARQAVTHIQENTQHMNMYFWWRVAVTPTGLWTVWVMCGPDAGPNCVTTADVTTFFNSIVIKGTEASGASQPAQTPQSTPPQSAPAAQASQAAQSSDPRKKIYLEYTGTGGNDFLAAWIPGVEPTSSDVTGERVKGNATKEFMKSCPSVVITTNEFAADFKLNLSGGNSSLADKDGTVVHLPPPHSKMSNIVKDACDYVNSH